MNRRQKIRASLLLISFLLFPVTFYYFSPVLAMNGLAAGVVSGSLLLFSLQFATALFWGRAFCGWLCPAGGLQETIARTRPRPVRAGNWIKWALWLPWAAGLLWLVLRTPVKAVEAGYMTNHGISVSGLAAYIVYYAVLGLIVILGFTAGRRSFCHHVCWMAPFMILGLKLRNTFRLPGLRLTLTSSCTHCGSCGTVCPMSLNVRRALEQGQLEKESECILCGNCADHCPQAAIRFRFGAGRLEG